MRLYANSALLYTGDVNLSLLSVCECGGIRSNALRILMTRLARTMVFTEEEFPKQEHRLHHLRSHWSPSPVGVRVPGAAETSVH